MPPALSVATAFAAVPDPRVDRTKKHLLGDILVIALAATIAGAASFPAVAAFGRARKDWLARFLRLPNGIPSPDTFRRVFARLDPRAFGACVSDWLGALCEASGLRHIAIDGKAVKGARRATFSGCLHLVNAWATENRLILGQEAVADGSNEIAAIPALLEVLALKGALVTLDAAGCQIGIARQIRAGGGDYLLAVKGNQPGLHTAVQGVFERAAAAGYEGVAFDHHTTAEAARGRTEERSVAVVYEPQGLPPDWPGVAAVVSVLRERAVGGEGTATVHYYVTSLRGTAEQLAGLIRRHWAVENELHWTLDVCFREDASRTRVENAGANLGLVRRVAVSLLKQDPSKGSIPTKRLQAALDEHYLERVLRGFQGSKTP
jgi:predicted transposase YbfD/YdcC